MIDFKNKKIIITGASGGIGRSHCWKIFKFKWKSFSHRYQTWKVRKFKKDFPNISTLKFDISEHSKIDEFIEKPVIN